jgi:hypothetical protein
MHDYTPNPRTDAVQSRGKLDRSLQKAVATSCSLAFGNHTRMARIIDLEATCHCRLSLASTHVRSRPSRSLTYVSDRSDDDAVASPHNHAHNKPHQHTYISHRLSIDHLGQRPLGRSHRWTLPSLELSTTKQIAWWWTSQWKKQQRTRTYVGYGSEMELKSRAIEKWQHVYTYIRVRLCSVHHRLQLLHKPWDGDQINSWLSRSN